MDDQILPVLTLIGLENETVFITVTAQK